MIDSRDGVYSVGGTPCRQLIEHAIARGWAKKPKGIVLSQEEQASKPGPKLGSTWVQKKEEPNPTPVPIPTPKSVQPMTLEDRAKMAGMSVDQLLDMRMRTRARTQGHEGDAM